MSSDIRMILIETGRDASIDKVRADAILEGLSTREDLLGMGLAVVRLDGSSYSRSGRDERVEALTFETAVEPGEYAIVGLEDGEYADVPVVLAGLLTGAIGRISETLKRSEGLVSFR